MENTREKGNEGEDMAATFLVNAGYKILERNWQSGKNELDLIVEKDDEIIFVEVKMRKSDSYGEPWEAVNQTKRRRVIQAANAYILRYKIEKKVRFDIVSIVKRYNQKAEILHIEEAFYPMP
jgi:putative endonuclease